MNAAPPKNALKFLRWFCREDYMDEIEGDLTELFKKRFEQSPTKARWQFTLSVFAYLRPAFIKSFKRYSTNPIVMFRHNLLVSYRNFLRYKSSFFINLFGLSTGLACAILIYLWVNDEMSIDKFHEKDARLYQVFQNLGVGDSERTIEYTPGLLAKALAEEMPEVEYATSVVPPYWFSHSGIIKAGTNRMKVSPQYVERDYFKAFTCPLVDGDKEQPLPNKNSILLSESLAIKLFQTTDRLVGKSVEWSQDEGMGGEYFISGIFEDVPVNSSVRFDVLLSYEQFYDNRPGLAHWGNSDPCTYVVLREGTDLQAFNNKIVDLKRQKTKNPEEGTFVAQRYSSKYLHGHYQLEHGGYGGGRIQYVRLFATIAIFIVAIASINFMNLSTARASRRLKEVGVKKAIGAGRRTLVWQYLSEAMLITFFSLMISILLVFLLLPAFNQLTAKQLSLQFTPTLTLTLLAITAITGLLSGSYPALYLSGFNPASVLKGKLTTATGEAWARKGLVVFQFALSIVLIVSVLVVYKQISFIQSKNLGYNRDNLVQFEVEWKGPGSIATLLTELKSVPGVLHVSCFYHNLLGDHGGISGLDWEGKNPDLDVDFANLEVGFEFTETMGIEMADGRPFTRDLQPERQIIFNEEAIKRMGITDPVGKVVKFWGMEKQIVGVTKNFNFESLYEEVKPCFFQVYPELPNIMVRIEAGTEMATLSQIEKLYRKSSPGLAFDYQFVDAGYQALYSSEQRVGILSRYFAGIAIVISCLGLFGLAAFTAERRIKEIGIRKILGASNAGIVGLLSADFTRMVLIAIVIALPVSYFIGLRWLEGFAYRIELEWWFFAGAGFAALLVAWITVGAQTLKAARINPAETLKNE